MHFYAFCSVASFVDGNGAVMLGARPEASRTLAHLQLAIDSQQFVGLPLLLFFLYACSVDSVLVGHKYTIWLFAFSFA